MLNLTYYRNDKQLGKDLLELGIKVTELLEGNLLGNRKDNDGYEYLSYAKEIKKKMEESRRKKAVLKLNKDLGRRRLSAREIFLYSYVVSKVFLKRDTRSIDGGNFLKRITKYRENDVDEIYNYWDIINNKTSLVKSGIVLSDSRKLYPDRDIIRTLFDIPKPQVKKKKQAECRFNSPLDIKKELDKYIIGQEQPKKVIAHAAYSYIRENQEASQNFPNILMLGPTGSGKTHLVKTLGKILQFPFVSVDATQITREGYVGGSIMEVLLRLQNVQKAAGGEKRGILYIDEIDKTAAQLSAQRDVSGRPVQEELLKVLGNEMVQGDVNFGGFKGRTEVELDTSKILVICGGSFQNFETENDSIGFSGAGDIRPQRERWTNNDLMEMGFIPELLGRLPVRVFLNDLSPEQLVDILKNPQVSPLENFRCLLPDDMSVESIPQEDLISIARDTVELGLGARGLLSVLEEYLGPKIYGEEDFKAVAVREG